MKATAEEREQIDEFFFLFRDMLDDVFLYPCIDKKTGTRRMAICVADRENDTIYVKGLYFLPYDPLYNRISLVEPELGVLMEKPPGWFHRRMNKVVNFFRYWRQ